MKKTIVIATDKEFENIENGEFSEEVLITGLGKVNAAITLTHYLFQTKGDRRKLPDLLINYGTAGSADLPIGSLVDCTRFFQRDMDVSVMEFIKGQTPFEKDIPVILDFSHIPNPINKHLLCGTGDNFVTETENETFINVYDMEAYALAKVCWKYNINFVSYKYITDNVNKKSVKDWNENCADGAELFKKLLEKYND